jgi:multiple sugar transport system ATP-binding protein
MHGRDVTRLPPRERDIAMVFQDYGLYPHLSVFENIAFPLRLRKVEAAELKRRVSEVAERLHLTRLLARKPAQVSGGEKQRVALGRALVRQPRVFLMDEPLSNLDAKLRIIMRTEIKRLVSDLGITTVYVTHDQVEAMALASRIGVMNQGVLEQVAEPLEVYDRPASIFVASFIGSPPMNLMEIGNGLPPLLAGLSRSLGAATTSGNIVIGVRPEHVELVSAPANGAAQATVELVEALGQDTYLYLRSGDTNLVAVTKRTRIRPGDIVGLHVEPEHIHVMDKETGRRQGG